MKLQVLLALGNLVVQALGSAHPAASWGRSGKKWAVQGARRQHHQYCCSVLGFGRRGRLASDASEKQTAGTTTAEVSPEKVSPADKASDLEGNAEEEEASTTSSGTVGFAQVITKGANTVRHFWTDAFNGSTALWTNFQVCQEIRKRVETEHELTYGEHAHLQRGADDKRKLLVYALLYAVNPQVFPYIIFYVPSMLPSTFEKQYAVRSRYESHAHERVRATLAGLSEVDKQLIEIETKLKGKELRAGSREAKRFEMLELQKRDALEILEARSKREVFQKLQQFMMVSTPLAPEGEKKKKKNETLPRASRDVPAPVVKALGKGLGLAGWRGLAPGFYIEYRLNEHLKVLGKGDEVLRRQSLDYLTEAELKEACNARAIDVKGVEGRDASSLRKSLAEWLHLTSTDVAARKDWPEMVFLPDRARLVGLGLNFLDSVREGGGAELQRKALLNRFDIFELI